MEMIWPECFTEDFADFVVALPAAQGMDLSVPGIGRTIVLPSRIDRTTFHR